jgi:ankyrin repeat protein
MNPDEHDALARVLAVDDVAELEQLLNAGVYIEQRFHFRRVPLHLAAENGALRCARLLLDRGAALEAQDQAGKTPLMVALTAGHASLAELFLKAGARISYRFKPEDTPETREQWRKALDEVQAESRKAYPEIHEIVEATLTGDERTDFQREMTENLLQAAIAESDVHAIHHCANLECLQLITAQPGVSLNVEDGAGEWPLKTFAEAGDENGVAWLLQRGADPNFTSTGDSALHAAVARNHIECARLLLAAGADPNQEDVDGCVPMWQLASEEMLDLLLAHGADPNVGDQCGIKPSHWVKDRKLKRRLLDLERVAQGARGGEKGGERS